MPPDRALVSLMPYIYLADSIQQENAASDVTNIVGHATRYTVARRQTCRCFYVANSTISFHRVPLQL